MWLAAASRDAAASLHVRICPRGTMHAIKSCQSMIPKGGNRFSENGIMPNKRIPIKLEDRHG
jgi:hypothetical protein